MTETKDQKKKELKKTRLWLAFVILAGAVVLWLGLEYAFALAIIGGIVAILLGFIGLSVLGAESIQLPIVDWNDKDE